MLKALSRQDASASRGRPRMLTLRTDDLEIGPGPHMQQPPQPEPTSMPANTTSLRDAVAAHERALINASLKRHHGSWAAAARELQMDRANLQRMAKRLNIEKS